MNTIGKMALKRDFVPFTNLFGIKVVDHSKGIKLVETGSNVSIFDIRQPTQVNDEIGAPPLARQFITRPLDISIGQAETFAGPAQPCARLHVRSGKFSWVAQTSNCHGACVLSVMFPEQALSRQRVMLPHEKDAFVCCLRLSQGAKSRSGNYANPIRTLGNRSAY